MPRLAIVNAHGGGNYVLSNVVQQANVCGTSTILFPRSDDWSDARRRAGVTTNNHEDMHAGEAETSILLAAHPESVRPEYRDADNSVDDRRHLLTIGMSTLAPDGGVIGRPSLASAEKGKALLDAFSELFASHLELLKDLE